MRSTFAREKSGADFKKKRHRDPKTQVARLTDSKNTITSKSMIRQNLPGAEWLRPSSQSRNAASSSCAARSRDSRWYAWQLRIPAPIVRLPVPDECPAMPSDCFNHCRTMPQHPRDRHFLPMARQKMPAKVLKKNKKTSPEFSSRAVQRLEAVWGLHLWALRVGD